MALVLTLVYLANFSVRPVLLSAPISSSQLDEVQQALHCSSNTSALSSSSPSISDVLYLPQYHSHLSVLKLNPAHLAAKTHEIQKLLYEHQYPADCGSARLLVSRGHESGFGSSLHVMGAHLAIALNEGRVFIWSDTAHEYMTDPETCGSVRNVLCHFRPPSKCTLNDLNSDNHRFIADYGGPEQVYRHALPEKVVQILRRSEPNATQDEIKYMWRAQSVAFLARLNDAALEQIRGWRFRSGPVHPHSAPFPPGVISAHIRHGDKGTEMPLIPTEKYFEAAEQLRWSHPSFLQRKIFVSTDDPNAIEWIRKNRTSPFLQWEVWWNNLERKATTKFFWHLEGLVTPRGQLCRRHLLELLMALECDAWIGTRSSNWNRLIDELRCIWVPKCSHPYLEVGRKDPDFNW